MKKINILFLFVFVLQAWGQNPDFHLKHSNINRKFQDFGVSFINDTTVVFSSSRYEVFMKRVWLGNREPFLNLFTGTIGENGDIRNLKAFKKELETKFHDSNLVFTKDGRTVYFNRNNYVKSSGKNKNPNKIQIFKASINENGIWEDIQKLPFVSEDYDFGHPTLNKDETKLYFVSNKPGGFGKTDIYVTQILNDSTYSVPRNLGPKVNTSKREFTPFLDTNDILYFSSDGREDSFGGLDIYATKEKSDTTYYDPINLGASINTIADDFGFVKNSNTNIGFIASNRKRGKGSDDIYFFKENKPVEFGCKSVLNGIVLDSKSNLPIEGAMVYLHKNENQNESKSTLTNNRGEFEITADCLESYMIEAQHKGHKKFRKTIDSTKIPNLTIKLLPIPKKITHFKEVGESVMLNTRPIFYDYGKSTVHKESLPEINKIASYMKMYPEIIIQIRSHADSRGSEKFNMNLSRRRAQTIKDLLIQYGVLGNRIIATGFGEMNPMNKCKEGVDCSEEEHLQNRRTDFVVLNPRAIER